MTVNKYSFYRAAVLTTKYDEYQKNQLLNQQKAKNQDKKLKKKVKRKRVFRTQPILLPPNVVVGAPQYAPAPANANALPETS